MYLQGETITKVIEVVDPLLLVAELGRNRLQLVDPAADQIFVRRPIRIVVIENRTGFDEEIVDDFISGFEERISLVFRFQHAGVLREGLLRV